MPQLDVSTFSPQLFWLGLCFIALYAILAKFFLPKIASVLETRQTTLNGYINKASFYREEAETLLMNYETALALAKKEAQEKSREAFQDINEKITLKKQLYLDKMATFQHAEEQKLYRAHVQARANIHPIAQDIARTLLKKVLPPSSPKRKRTS